MTTLSTVNRLALAISASIYLAACADIGPPVAELTQAEASINEAEAAGGQEHGAAALQSARTNLAAAQRATNDKQNEEALRLASEADVDAKLAKAQTDRGKSEASLREIDKGLDTLHDESTQHITEPTQRATEPMQRVTNY